MEELRYGQIIRIHGDTTKRPKGLVFSKGFTSNGVWYQTYDQFPKLNNYRECLFQILPKGSFEIHDDYVKALKQGKDTEMYMRRKTTEEEQYWSLVEQKKDEEVLFGQEVVFRHIDSKSYLVSSIECSEFSTEAFKVFLSDTISSQALFQIQPYKSFQKEGSCVSLDESIVLMSSKQKQYLDSINQPLNMVLEGEQQLYQSIKKSINQCQRFEMVISENKKSCYKIKLHQSLEQQRQVEHIKGYDLVTFQYTKNNNYLSIDLKENKLILSETCDFTAIWEIQPIGISMIQSQTKLDADKNQNTSTNFLVNSRLMQTQNLQDLLSQDMKGQNYFILRHFSTGKVLAVSEQYQAPKAELQDIEMDKSQVFQIRLAKSIETELKYDSYVSIMYQGKTLQQVKKRATKNEEENLNTQQYQETMFTMQKSTHAFQVIKLDEQHQQSMAFVLSAQEVLYNLSTILSYSIDKIYETLSDPQGQKILDEAIVVMKGCLENLKKWQQINQKAMKDLLIIEIIISILNLITTNELVTTYTKQWKTEREKVKHVQTLSYRLIKELTTNNKKIKLHVSQWLNFFLKQAMVIDQDVVQSSLSELLNDNYDAISKYINNESIEGVIEILTQQIPHENYLRILSSICVCKDQAIVNNQNCVLEAFFKMAAPEFAFKFKRDKDQVLIYAFLNRNRPKWRSLPEFFAESKEINNSQPWNYFMSYMKLLADVCTHKNSAAQAYVQEQIPSDILCCLVEDDFSKQSDSLEPYLNLVLRAYIDDQKYNAIKKIELVKEWSAIDENDDIPTAKIDSHNIKRILQFVQRYLDQKATYNHTLLRILSILKTSLELGFFSSIKDLKQVLENLLIICSCKQDFTEGVKDYQKQKEKLTRDIPENQIMMQCKIMACDIIQIIYELEAGVRLNRLMQKFKEFLEQKEESESVIEEEVKNFKQRVYEKMDKMLFDKIRQLRKKKGHSQGNGSPTTRRSTALPQLKKFAHKLKQHNKDSFETQIQEFDWTKFLQEILEECNITKDLALNMEVIFVEVSLFQNAQMLESSLKLLNQMHGSRRILFNYFSSVIVLDEGLEQTQRLTQEIGKIRVGLEELSNRAILQVSLDNQQEFNLNIWPQKIKDIHTLCCSLRQTPLKKIELDNLYLIRGVRQVFDECQENEKIHQQLMRAEDIHKPIIQFVEMAKDLDKDSTLQMKLLDICYEFLTLFVWNNTINKLEIDIKLCYQHLKHNLCCADLLREVFHNNKDLLYNENEVNKCLKNVIELINQQPMSSFYKSKLMDILRVLQYDNSKIISKNQQMTLSALQDKRYYQVMIMFIKNKKQGNIWDVNIFHWCVQKFIKSYKENRTIIVEPQLMYMITFFQLLCLLVEEKNAINTQKCRALHPYRALIQILGESIDVWPLQHFIRAYVNRLYYRHNHYDTYIFVEYDIPNIVQQLESVVKFKTVYTSKSKLTINNGIRYKFLSTYVFTTLQEIFYTLNFQFVNDDFLEELEETLEQHSTENQHKLHINIIKIAAFLEEIHKIWFKSGWIQKFARVLSDILNVIIKTFKFSDLRKCEQLMYPQISRLEDSVQDKIITKLINFAKVSERQKEEKTITDSVQFQMSMRKLLHIKTKNKLLFQQEQDLIQKELNIKHEKLINYLNENQKFISHLNEEQNQLSLKLDSIDKEAEKLYSTQLITLKDFIRNIIIMNISIPDCLNEQLRIFFLTVLVRMIAKYNTNPEAEGVPIDQWSPEMWSDSKKPIEEEQNFLDECGAAALIYQMFKDPSLQEKWALCSQLIVFTNAYLLGGNTKCQNSLLQLMKADGSNIVLTNIRTLITKFSSFVHTNYSNPVDDSKKNNQNPLVQCFYVDQISMWCSQTDALNRGLKNGDSGKEADKQKQQSIEVLFGSFRMLQLLCENNNVEMKNFLRDQSVINSVNFIEFATKELRFFFQILNQTIIPIASQIVEFINEIIQLPCLLNQKTLCRSTYFEDACYTCEFFSNPKHRQLREFESEDELHELYSKVISSVLQVLEGNDIDNYSDLCKKLSPQFLVTFVNEMMANEIFDVQELMKNKTFPESLQRILDVCIIKEKIQQKLPDSNWVTEIHNSFEEQKEIYQFCLKNLRRIEIFYEKEQQTIFFPSHPVFAFLSNETRDKIMFEIPRETQREKLINLVQLLPVIFNEIEYNFVLNQKTIPINQETITMLINIAQTTSCLINLIMVATYKVVIYPNKTSELTTGYWWEILLKVMGIFQLLVSFVLFVFYVINRAPLELKSMQRQKSSNPWKFMINQIMNCYQIIQSDDFLNYLFYLGFACLGTFINTCYFSIQLFYVFGRLALLKSVFQAISHNAQQLTLVAMLGVLFQFVFSMLAFYNYVDDIYPENADDACHSLLSCMITLMTSGVVGSSMSVWDPTKFFYDTTYFVFYALLFSNIISGIMTDTFAELRDQRQHIEDDKKNLCFICGIDRATLEKNQLQFEEHISDKHTLWNYAFYLYCLKNKDSVDYTGLQYWIMDKVENENISWFPIVDGDDQTGVEENLEGINSQLEELTELLNKDPVNESYTKDTLAIKED